MLATLGVGVGGKVKVDSPTDNQGARYMYRLGEGATCRNSAVISHSHFEIGHVLV